jgi:hypothetical protein
MIVDAIKRDGSLKHDEGDWWTSHTDEAGNVYDINVFDNEIDPDIADNEFKVSVYDCYLRDDGYYETDYEGDGYPSFKVKKRDLIKEKKNIRVFVYYNLHKKKWSIKALEGVCKNKVIGHADVVQLKDVTPKVSQAGRNRVIKEQCKNVHAGITGILTGYTGLNYLDLVGDDCWQEITYNPYLYETFVYKDDDIEFKGADMCYMFNKEVFVK